MIETRFKQTEIGLIPEDWKLVTLGSVSMNASYGIGAPSIDYDGINKYIRITDIDDNTRKFVPSPLSSPAFYTDDYIVSEGEILIARTGASVGKTYIYNSQDGCLIYAGFLIKLHISDAVPMLVFYNTLTENYNQFIISQSARTGQPGINLQQLKKFLFAVPSNIQEQQRIATALSDIDALISALNKKIEKKKLIKQGAMQQLLNGKKRLQGFTEPWVEKRLGEIGYTYNGLSGKSKENFGIGKAKYITFLNVLMNEAIDVTDLEFVNVVDDEKQNQVKKGDLFFNTSSETPEEVGMCSTLIQNISNTYLNSFCFGFRPFNSTKINSMFFAYLFRSQIGRDLMSTLAQGSTRHNLSKGSFLKSFISVPSLTEQTTIAKILSDMDKEISDLEVKKAKYEQIKQGMMQQLLTGKIRLI